ncbi:MAG: hypothetical protein WHS64_09540 [Fervidobacterium sp.]|uniref:hypothetical protein n=1 Tax=Fervidobacterium TaxID=2422 RepID=UPI0030A01028
MSLSKKANLPLKNKSTGVLEKLDKMFFDMVSKLNKKQLKSLWEFFHLYYVVNKTLKTRFYVHFGSNKLYLFFTPRDLHSNLATPIFLPNQPIDVVHKDVVQFIANREAIDQEKFQILEALVKYNSYCLGVKEEKEREKAFENAKSGSGVKDVCEFFGLYFLYEWELDDHLKNVFTMIIGILNSSSEVQQAADKFAKIHELLEVMYNYVLATFLKMLPGDETLEIYANHLIKLGGKVYADSKEGKEGEVDILLLSQAKRKVL